MDYLTHPKKPALISHLSAKMQADQWTQYNVINTITDGDGLKWKVAINSEEKIADQKRLLITTISFEAHASGQDLVATRTLEKMQDARLISLIGNRKIPFILKPLVFHASTVEEVHRMVSLRLNAYKKEFCVRSLSELKRKWIGIWIDRQKRFDELLADPET